MNFYQEITLLPDVEISLGFLWQNVFQQVHIALVEHKVAENQSAVAVGFPDYRNAKFPLGNKLRLFAKDQATLEKLAIDKWLTRLEDYVHIKGIKPVPDSATYVSFERKQVKSPERVERELEVAVPDREVLRRALDHALEVRRREARERHLEDDRAEPEHGRARAGVGVGVGGDGQPPARVARERERAERDERRAERERDERAPLGQRELALQEDDGARRGREDLELRAHGEGGRRDEGQCSCWPAHPGSAEPHSHDEAPGSEEA